MHKNANESAKQIEDLSKFFDRFCTNAYEWPSLANPSFVGCKTLTKLCHLSAPSEYLIGTRNGSNSKIPALKCARVKINAFLFVFSSRFAQKMNF